MTLRGTTPGATYDDIVHVNQSGAGLPDHAGAEAALYVDDGAGGVDQIIGRTAVRHWLDPHPDAAGFDETWEFSTTGDMTQAALETAGWTFSNCTGVVSNGLLILETSAPSVKAKAYISTSLSGDFDIVVTPMPVYSYGDTSITYMPGAGVADYRAGVADVMHYGIIYRTVGYGNFYRYASGAFTTHGGTSESDTLFGGGQIVRLARVSGSLRVTAGNRAYATYIADDTAYNTSGYVNNAAISDSSTFNYLTIVWESGNATNGGVHAIANIRRFQ